MRLAKLFSLIGLCSVVGFGCGGEGVGDPCAPTRPMSQPCVPSNSMMQAGCFTGTEVYLETQSLQCRSRICLVYKYAEVADMLGTNRPKHVYCTCRCGVPPSLVATTDSNVLCTCPEEFTCKTDLAGPQYNPGVQGSYCIRSSTNVP